MKELLGAFLLLVAPWCISEDTLVLLVVLGLALVCLWIVKQLRNGGGRGF